MRRTIVYESHNLTLTAGTGIATYAKHLATAAKGLGYSTHALVAASSFLRKGDATLANISLNDAPTAQSLAQRLWLEMQWVVGAPLGKRAIAIKPSNTAVDAAADKLSGFDVVHAANNLFEVAKFHFRRHGRRLEVKLDSSVDLFHATQATPIKVPGCPNIYTLHDLVPLRVPHVTLENKSYYFDMVRDLARNADHIVTVSEFSRRDIMELTGIGEDRITNTYQAVSLPKEHLDRLDSDVANDLERIYGLGWGKYFLFVGALEPKKNLIRLIEAYASSGTKYPLVIVGGLGWQYDDILEKIGDERFLRYIIKDREISIERKVRRLDYVPLGRLVSLLRGARAMLFPSIYEGFGLPVAEAMLAGAPVVTSSTTSLAEVAGDAALLVDPYDIDAMAAAIATLDNDADLRADLAQRGRTRAAKFSPEAYSARINELYTRLLK